MQVSFAAAQAGTALRARDMFYSAGEPGRSSAATTKVSTETEVRPCALGIRYAILKKTASGEWLELAPESVFHSGDRIRITVTANAPGYLYIINRGSSGAWTPLYPPADGQAPQLEAGKELTFPPEGSFMFNDQPGTEELFLLFARWPITQLPPAAEQSSTVAKLDDRSVAAIRNAYSRDLVIESLDDNRAQALKDHGVYVVNTQPGPDKDMVVVDLQLKHN